MPYDSESKRKNTKPLETTRSSVDETCQRFGLDEADAPRTDETEIFSVRMKNGSNKESVFSFIHKEHLLEAREFMSKGYNSQIPVVDSALVAKLLKAVADTGKYKAHRR